MNEYKLSDALENLPDGMIVSAMNAGASPGKRRRFAAMRVARRVGSGALAVVLLLALFLGLRLPGKAGIVTAPGVLVMTAYAGGADAESVVLSEGVEVTTDAFNQTTGGAEAKMLLLRLSLPEQYGTDITFTAEPVNGYIYTVDEAGKLVPEENAVLANNASLYWVPNIYAVNWKDEGCFLQIVIRDGDNIIGYGLMEGSWSLEDGQLRATRATLLESVYYPKVDGAYQDVTLEYVQQQMRDAMDRVLPMEEWDVITDNPPAEEVDVTQGTSGIAELWANSVFGQLLPQPDVEDVIFELADDSSAAWVSFEDTAAMTEYRKALQAAGFDIHEKVSEDSFLASNAEGYTVMLTAPSAAANYMNGYYRIWVSAPDGPTSNAWEDQVVAFAPVGITEKLPAPPGTDWLMQDGKFYLENVTREEVLEYMKLLQSFGYNVVDTATDDGSKIVFRATGTFLEGINEATGEVFYSDYGVRIEFDPAPDSMAEGYNCTLKFFRVN